MIIRKTNFRPVNYVILHNWWLIEPFFRYKISAPNPYFCNTTSHSQLYIRGKNPYLANLLVSFPFFTTEKRRMWYEGRFLCSETGNFARAEVLPVKSLREQACQSQNIMTGPRIPPVQSSVVTQRAIIRQGDISIIISFLELELLNK